MLEMDVFSACSGSGSCVPASVTTGTGTAWVFADGLMVTGTWSRETENDWFVLTAEDGTELPVPPGQLWLILPVTGGVVPAAQ